MCYVARQDFKKVGGERRIQVAQQNTLAGASDKPAPATSARAALLADKKTAATTLLYTRRRRAYIMADVSVRAEARKALAQFARLYPKPKRTSICVSAYGVRCILNEVALEQLSPARLAEACEDAIRIPAMLKPRPRGGRGDVKPEPPSRVAIARRAHRRVRKDSGRQYPFVDDEQQGVAAVLSGEASRDASKFLEAPPAEQARRARGVFAALRTQPNRLLRSAAGPALEEVAGRPPGCYYSWRSLGRRLGAPVPQGGPTSSSRWV